jgi:hypothetical protein
VLIEAHLRADNTNLLKSEVPSFGINDKETVLLRDSGGATARGPAIFTRIWVAHICLAFGLELVAELAIYLSHICLCIGFWAVIELSPFNYREPYRVLKDMVLSKAFSYSFYLASSLPS